MLEPAVAAKSSNYLRYASANKGAMPFMDPSFVNDERIYPNAEVRAKCSFLKETGPFHVSKRYWREIQDAIKRGVLDSIAK